MRIRHLRGTDVCTHPLPARSIRLTIRGRREPLTIETAGELAMWWRSKTEWETGEELERLMREIPKGDA